MAALRIAAILTLAAFLPATAATLGRVVAVVGGVTDLVLDEPRGRLYLTSSLQNLVQVYSFQRQAIQTTVQTDQTPLAAALSRDGRFLYVACYDSSSLNIIDVNTLTVTGRVGLPARPQGVAVGRDGRVLISTSGSGTGSTANVLLLYNPALNASPVLTSIPVAPAAPSGPTFPAPLGRPFLGLRSQLVATRDGSRIAGVTMPAAGNPTVFVYETASTSLLRARIIAATSASLSISDDGTRIQFGPILFDTSSLQILAQQNVANVPYPMDPATNFTPQAIQGGSVFAPDGQTLYAAYNIAPVQTPAPVSQLMLNDPDNLLTQMGIQLPENLAGKIVISADGANAYALSDSGFVILPLSTIPLSPLAVPSSTAALLTRDPCLVNAQTLTATITLNNPGRGRVTANAQLLQFAGRAGQAAPATAPSVRAVTTGTNPQLVFTHNAAARNLGTVAPAHDFVISSPEAINIPDRVRVLENTRDPEARGTIVPIPTGTTVGEPLPDLVYDTTRQRIYLANSGFNRVEVYDVRQQRLLAPIKVGQSPVSLALTPDGNTLFVANAGSESLSIVDPDRVQATGRVSMPPIPLNTASAVLTPNLVAAGLSGPQVVMSNGSLWKVVGESAVPRGISKVIGQTPQGLPANIPLPSSMAATPGGEFILLVSSNSGFAYLYDATADDFVAGRQIFTPATQTGYLGPVSAAPGGQYFVVNGAVLNQSLVTSGRPATGLLPAVAAVNANTYALYSVPAAAGTTTPTLQVFNAATGTPTLQISGLEGPFTQVAAAGRGTMSGRTMALDATSAYLITISGLSILPLTPVLAADRPVPNVRGAVNLGSYQVTAAPNGLLSIFGSNLAAAEVAGSTPLPVILGGTCVTLNNIALPLFMASPLQINAQIPPNLAPGNYPLVIRSIARQAAGPSQQLTVSRVAPAVLVAPSGQILLFHADGVAVNQDHPANRDERLTMYAVGLGATTGGPVTSGVPSPLNPLAEVDVQVFFGNPGIKEAEVIVDWSGLAPGFIGLYQLNLRVPGAHINGDEMPVTIRVGTVSSPTTGPVVPYVTVK